MPRKRAGGRWGVAGKTSAALKRRTREHVIAALSANFLARFFLKAGHTVLEVEEDYGIDLIVFTHDEAGHVEPGQVYLQLKATDAPAVSADSTFLSFSISASDYNAWTAEPLPVFLILYDAAEERAYWQYIQAYFESDPSRRPSRGASSVVVRLPVANAFGDATVAYIRSRKQAVLGQLSGVIRHER